MIHVFNATIGQRRNATAANCRHNRSLFANLERSALVVNVSFQTTLTIILNPAPYTGSCLIGRRLPPPALNCDRGVYFGELRP